MVNAQEWLEKNYLEIRRSVRELYINEKDLEGDLDLTEFANLQKIYISHYVDENKLKIGECINWEGKREKTKIVKLAYASNAQEYLDNNFPKEERGSIRRLDLTNLDLKGDLDLSDFKYLEIYLAGNPQLREIKNKNVITKILHIDAQVWLNWKYPKQEEVKEIRLKRDDNGEAKERILGELIITDFLQLEKIDVGGSNYDGELTKLQINNCPRLTKLNCFRNKLTELIVTDCPKLEKLDIVGNNFFQDLSFLSHLVNLKTLDLANNHFTGSLKLLQKLDKLKELNISDTDISHGLEYLPLSVTIFRCSFVQRPEARVSDIWEELQPFDDDIKKWREVKWDKKLALLTSPLLPPQLTNKIKSKNKLVETHDISEINYNEILFNQWDKINFLTPHKLPTKLYNIEEGEVEESKDNPNIQNYAILSYVWGDPNKDKNKLSKEQKEELDNTTISIGYKNSDLLTRLGYKSWKKSIKALKIINEEKYKELTEKNSPKITNEELKKELKDSNININHLWVDQLCINQKDNKDKANEVPKMRQYYDNSSITLISINAELSEESDHLNILKKIINSEWFTRSWTFQEGWLSKQTIFMFDDCLIDGRTMAGTWALNQLGYANEGRYLSRREFEKGTKKIATPVGWVYYRDGYNLEDNEKKDIKKDKVEMTLSQTLKAIKKKGRSMAIDGIYSILGLLPYGEHVKVNYSQTPEQALYEVMKVAMGYRKRIEPADYTLDSGYPSFEVIKETLPDGEKVIEYIDIYMKEKCYGEPIAWHGTSNATPGFCWMPQVYEDGSTSVEGGIDVNWSNDIDSFEEEKGLKFFTDIYVICEVTPNIQKLEGGFEIEGGLYKKDIWLKGKEGNNKTIQISLLGTQGTLELVDQGKCLLVPFGESWTSKKPFALLAENTRKTYEFSPIYHRLGLVELGNGESLPGDCSDKIIVGNNLQEQLQAQIIQIPPKKNW